MIKKYVGKKLIINSYQQLNPKIKINLLQI